MKIKKILGVAAVFAVISLLFAACSGDSNNEFAPYKGQVWHAPYNTDTLCLKVTTTSDVLLSLNSTGEVVAHGAYKTLRGEFQFSDFAAEIGGVEYRFHYALFSPQLDMVLYGDSINAECDSVPVEWSCRFVPLAK